MPNSHFSCIYYFFTIFHCDITLMKENIFSLLRYRTKDCFLTLLTQRASVKIIFLLIKIFPLKASFLFLSFFYPVDEKKRDEKPSHKYLFLNLTIIAHDEMETAKRRKERDRQGTNKSTTFHKSWPANDNDYLVPEVLSTKDEPLFLLRLMFIVTMGEEFFYSLGPVCPD